MHAYIAKGGYTLDELNTELYAIPKTVYGTEMTDKELKGLQGNFFRNVYRLLIDKEKGPRLYLFLYAIEADKYVGLLDFSNRGRDRCRYPLRRMRARRGSRSRNSRSRPR